MARQTESPAALRRRVRAARFVSLDVGVPCEYELSKAEALEIIGRAAMAGIEIEARVDDDDLLLFAPGLRNRPDIAAMAPTDAEVAARLSGERKWKTVPVPDFISDEDLPDDVKLEDAGLQRHVKVSGKAAGSIIWFPGGWWALDSSDEGLGHDIEDEKDAITLIVDHARRVGLDTLAECSQEDEPAAAEQE